MSHSRDILALSPECDPNTGTYEVHFDPTEYAPSTVVVLAVAAVTETDPLELEILNHCVDPECLNGLFGPKQDGTPRTGGHVTLSFVDHEVTVHSDGTVRLAPSRPDSLDHPAGSRTWDTVSKEEKWQQYRDNLLRVLDYVELLLDSIDADPVVVSSDHGEAVGE